MLACQADPRHAAPPGSCLLVRLPAAHLAIRNGSPDAPGFATRTVSFWQVSVGAIVDENRHIYIDGKSSN